MSAHQHVCQQVSYNKCPLACANQQLSVNRCLITFVHKHVPVSSCPANCLASAFTQSQQISLEQSYCEPTAQMSRINIKSSSSAKADNSVVTAMRSLTSQPPWPGHTSLFAQCPAPSSPAPSDRCRPASGTRSMPHISSSSAAAWTCRWHRCQSPADDNAC